MTIFQPPVLLFRNLFSVPGTTRVSAYATLLFELAGLSNQALGPHLCYSAYSLTLALALHPHVAGWDTDVIAEDHHMFCKCYFAPLWERVLRNSMHEAAPIAPQVRLEPIYLPAIGYLAESTAGYIASLRARYMQARRHSEGVVELGYLLLQYFSLVMVAGFSKISWRTHFGVATIAAKMYTVHIISTVQSLSLVFAGILIAPTVQQWVLGGGLASALQELSANGTLAMMGAYTSFEFAGKALVLAFGPVPPVAFVSAGVAYLAVRDTLEGLHSGGDVSHGPSSPSTGSTKLGWFKSILLLASVQFDMSVLAEPTIFLYGMIPELQACMSVMRRGGFLQYVVAAKPV
eukprot:NODE_3165_length_2081_cov_6.395087.p1 GENE.NODE_3165_length_2081_cov_6.395087~~NODE_3165_length_2081_cov_6.395087.p1  ORF type:complete len:347 (-),score=82.43 NODE_3165_length_2081_cov_6.395087:286-1326(-)